jgi:predicted lipid-binding transport protein (Tim44 family)|tara:strand:+ start:592 stop:1182 length:591 start_codon:yes stop_codon:yes gene_type:complete
MNYSFEYIDIILLAMIAGFIFLRLRGILGRRTGHQENLEAGFSENFKPKNVVDKKENNQIFDENAKKEFIKGAKIAYESIITSFAKGDLKNISYLLDKKILDDFTDAVQERKKNNNVSETTFIGVNSAEIKEHKDHGSIIEVVVDFESEIISCVKDKDGQIISGDMKKIKKVHDTWKFTKDKNSSNPNWLLVDTQI